MIAFVGCRQTGKTSRLIRLSHETGFPIVAATMDRARAIEHAAARMRVSIPKPLAPQDMRSVRGLLLKDNRVLVDEVADFVGTMIGARVVGATMEGVAIECDGSTS